jgi:hypothetical protein
MLNYIQIVNGYSYALDFAELERIKKVEGEIDMRINIKNMLLWILVLTGLTACGGGGGASSIRDQNIIPDIIKDLSPLKINMLDLNNNPIQYIDISKIGSHTLYKLKFTNINNVAVDLGYLGSGDYYYLAMADSMGMTQESYRENYAPGGAYRLHMKTPNSDNCLNQADENGWTPLEPGGSCSYYTYALNDGTNFTTQDMFAEPVSYTLLNTSLHLSLEVVQCTRSGGGNNPIQYNCSNMTKPGFSEQFISYRILPINGTTNIIPDISYGNDINQDGDWFWRCTSTECNKYSLNYDRAKNTLIRSTIPESTITIYGGVYIQEIYPSIDGSNVWVSSYNNREGYKLVNTAMPNTLLTSYCGSGRPCVPFINATSTLGFKGIIGLDGSFWWDTGADYNADIYDPISQTFVQTNIPTVVGVNPDGTVIGFSDGKPGCWNSGSSYTSYIYRGALLNYTPPFSTHVVNAAKNVYMEMPVPGIIGNFSTYLTAYYKVHTENGLCQVDLDDYTYRVSWTNKYTLGGSGIFHDTFSVTSIDNVYLGK